MREKPLWASYTTILLVLIVSIAMPTLHSTDLIAATPIKLSWPISETELEDWRIFIGVGTQLRYPAAWQGQSYQAQGSVREGATYRFSWVDERGRIAQIDMLEIVDPDVGQAALSAEMAYWQERSGYHVEQTLKQEYTAWWIQMREPQAEPSTALSFAETVWIDYGDRVYRLRLRCRAAAQEESQQVLRQMLSTLEPQAIDWRRAGGSLPSFSSVGAREGASPSSRLAGVPYSRSAAYAYAETYWHQQHNDDNCYLWYNGSTLDCTYHTGAWGVDGAHFANRAVRAGGRPIPGLWDGAALRVPDLRDWLQNDGWTVVSASQAQAGDVVIIGPFDNPCWTGLVVETGNDPVVATHSGEYWTQASLLSCSTGSQKTYLHAEVKFALYLPVVKRNYPPPPPPTKQWSGMHLGNRIYGDWSAEMLAPFHPESDGIWPRIVVAQSDQVFTIQRYDEPNCRISGVSVKNWGLFTYLRQAAQAGTWVVIRITPSPGNFQKSIESDWPDPKTRPAERTLITEADVRPGGWLQCGNAWRFRPVDDVGDEILAIQRYILWQAPPGYGWQAFGFEPANEPNVEWYWKPHKDNVSIPEPSFLEVDSWIAMDQYFANLYDYVHANAGELPVRVLTPPMAQSAYAETNDINSDTCSPFPFSGYEVMALTFNSADPKNDGYSWHNYWVVGREAWAACPAGQHVSMWFPNIMVRNIQSGAYPAIITEADLASPQQEMGSLLTDKDLDPVLAATSIRTFLRHEALAEYIAVWLLNDDTGSDTDHTWHQAYTPPSGFRAWFTEWWNGNEGP